MINQSWITKVLGINANASAVHVVKRPAGRVVIPTGICIEVRDVQLVNTVSSTIFVSPVGSKMDVREVLLLNVLVFNIVTCVADKLIDSKEVQPSNADAPILVTPEGIIIEVRVLQLRNTESPIVRSPDGILTDVSELQPLNELASSEVTPVADILMDSKRVELWNTFAFMAVTEEPRVTFAGMGPE
jgi:hypothetical protein